MKGIFIVIAAVIGASHIHIDPDVREYDQVDEIGAPPEDVKFKTYPPERTPKVIRWSNGVVTNCRNSNHLAFTFDDGIKYHKPKN